MDVSEKRKLLDAIDILVKRPAHTNEETLGHALAYFKMLIEEATSNELSVEYKIKELRS